MTEKEMNLAILAELYNAANETWEAVKTGSVEVGSYTAVEVARMVKKRDLQIVEDKCYAVTVGNFTCSFTSYSVFAIVAKFETLAKVGSRRKLFTATPLEESGEKVGSVTFRINKDMGELCDFADKNRGVSLGYIMLDVVNKCLVASDCRKLLSLSVDIIGYSGDVSDLRLNPKNFASICENLSKKGSHIATATKTKIYDDEYTEIRVGNTVALAQKVAIYPKWRGVIPYVSNDLTLNLGKYGAWKSIKEATKKTKGVIFISGKTGKDYVTIEYDNCNRDFVIGGTVPCDFRIAVKGDNINACKQIDTLYLGRGAQDSLVGKNKQGGIYLIMPVRYDNEEQTTYVNSGNAAFDVCVLEERTQSVEGAKTEPKTGAKAVAIPVAVQPMEEAVPEKPLNEAKEAKSEAPAKEVAKQTEAVKAAPPLDMGAKKFAFAKVGVNIGDTLTFIDGTKVTAADGNKVEYNGELYTLSGYCKAFMPESKKNKANAYRGCEYFYNMDGVKLGKLFKEYQKSVAVPLEVQNEEAEKAKIKAVKPLKRSGHTITHPDKEKATEPKRSSRVYSWLRRTLGRVHRIAAAFSL